MGVMLVPATLKHLLNKAVEQGSLLEMAMLEYNWKPTGNTAQLCRNPQNTNAKSTPTVPSLLFVRV